MTASADDAKWAFSAYESVRHRLPSATFPRLSKRIDTLNDLVPHFDVFLLDAFGVLNVGESVIPSAPDRGQRPSIVNVLNSIASTQADSGKVS